MKIKNKTSVPQDLHLRDRNLFYLVTIPAGATQEISPTCDISNLDELLRYDKVVIVDKENPHSIVITKEETPDISEKIIQVDTDEGSVEVTEDIPTTAEDKFICSICGAEFASNRGLTSHMKRVHADSMN